MMSPDDRALVEELNRALDDLEAARTRAAHPVRLELAVYGEAGAVRRACATAIARMEAEIAAETGGTTS